MTHADLVEAGPGVWAAIAKPDRGAVGNAAIVDLGDETLVVDTHVSPAAGASCALRPRSSPAGVSRTC